MTLSDYINQRLSYEEYAFSLDELQSNSDKSEVAITRELSRHVKKGDIISLRKGFYLIIPPRYSTSGKVPIQLYAEKLFKYLNRDYYLGFYTAAKFHGASHQQIQSDYVMIEQPKLYNTKKDNVHINFITTSKWPKNNIIKKTGDAGFFNISSPALTAIDLIHHQTKLGGLNRMLAVLEELLEAITLTDVENVLRWYPYKSTLQRFGFLLDELGADAQITQPIIEHLREKPYYPVLLSPRSQQKAGAVDTIWKVDVNIKLESDL
ncbi:type IV toxin-antitoxin system AbiEi family antitoxin domain-containing protein [Winogradskyella sp. A3E31]|uniref:type IV toxin-antitoxin system AbiEi family antitoxin domain-containing protein n=1 Tax=Winogradskyella sp. A3E31 TaxID=3349637 RepID=UPI00398AFAB1